MHGDPTQSGISIQISAMTVPEEEDVAAGIVGAARHAMNYQEEDAGRVIVPQSVDAAPKPAVST